jgi:nucleotide-binding universal stress UspA family protein
VKILYATDGSEPADAARAFLRALPLPAGTEIQSLVVHGPFSESFYAERPTLSRLWRERQSWAARALADAAELDREGIRITGTTVSGDASHEILVEADRFGADLIVVGSRGLTGFEGFVLGSVARNVAHHASRPVLVARAPRHRLRTVILATDGSKHAEMALEFLCRLPLPRESGVLLAHVVRPHSPATTLAAHTDPSLGALMGQIRQEQEEDAAALLHQAAARCEAAGRASERVVRWGDPSAELLMLLQETEADLLVLGARGRSLIQGLIVGSVADRMLKRAQTSVLVVHPPPEPVPAEANPTG